VLNLVALESVYLQD